MRVLLEVLPVACEGRGVQAHVPREPLWCRSWGSGGKKEREGGYLQN